MGKFTGTATPKINHRKAHPRASEIKETRNFESGKAFTLPAKERLATRVMTSMINEKSFYGDTTSELLNDLREVAKTDPLFILKLAAYTRNIMFLRSAPTFVLAHGSMIPEVKPYIRQWTPKILKRADEPAETLAAINSIFTEKGEKPVIPNSIKKGISDALRNFDAYQLMKYKGEGQSVNLWDVFNVCHPKPTNGEQASMWKSFMNSELNPAKTWETELSKTGQTGKSKAKAWEDIIPSMGYMAIIRNLRNFIQEGLSDELISEICKKLTDPKAVAKNKQLPFRYFSAYRELEKLTGKSMFARDYWGNRENRDEKVFTAPEEKTKIKKLMRAVDKAMALSVQNVDQLPGVTAIFSDHSASMDSSISSKSSITHMNVAMVLHALTDSLNPENVGAIFGESIAAVDSEGLTPMKFIEAMVNTDVGHSTNAWLCFDHLTKSKVKVDRIILLSDMQCYNSSGYGLRSGSRSVSDKWDTYRTKVNPDAWFHSIDLAGYGTSVEPINSKNVSLFAGWNTRFLDVIKGVEKGVGGLVEEIENYS